MTTVIGPETAISLYMTQEARIAEVHEENRKMLWFWCWQRNTKLGKWAAAGGRGQTGRQAHTRPQQAVIGAGLLSLAASLLGARQHGREEGGSGGRGVGRRKCTRGGIGHARAAGRGTRWLGNERWAVLT